MLAHADVVDQLLDLPGWAHTGGALHARFHAPSVPAALALLAQAFEVAEEMDHHPDVDLRREQVRLALSTHDVGGVTQLDVELAHRVTGIAVALGAERMTPAADLIEIGIDTPDPDRLTPFWLAALGYEAVPGGEELVDPLGRGPGVWFQRTATPASPAGQRGRAHVDVTVADPAVAAERRAAVEAAGGRLLSDAHAPSWWVYADPDGNELCICTMFGREG